MPSRDKERALEWLWELAEIQMYLAQFLREDDYESFLHAKDLLRQLAEEVLRGKG